MTITEDASAPAVVTGTGAGTLTTASFSPPSGSMLVAIVGLGTGGSTNNVTIADSGTHTWTLGVKLVGTGSGGFGVIGIFYTYLSSAPGSITVTATFTGTTPKGRSLAVKVLNGAKSSQVGAASATFINETATVTTASVSITTTATGSVVYGMSVATLDSPTFTANGSSTKINEYNDSVTDFVDITQWKATSATSAPGATSLGGTWSVNAATLVAAFEVLPAAAGAAARLLIISNALGRSTLY